jgi:hypothetical protein
MRKACLWFDLRLLRYVMNLPQDWCWECASSQQVCCCVARGSWLLNLIGERSALNEVDKRHCARNGQPPAPAPCPSRPHK